MFYFTVTESNDRDNSNRGKKINECNLQSQIKMAVSPVAEFHLHIKCIKKIFIDMVTDL